MVPLSGSDTNHTVCLLQVELKQSDWKKRGNESRATIVLSRNGQQPCAYSFVGLDFLLYSNPLFQRVEAVYHFMNEPRDLWIGKYDAASGNVVSLEQIRNNGIPEHFAVALEPSEWYDFDKKKKTTSLKHYSLRYLGDFSAVESSPVVGFRQ